MLTLTFLLHARAEPGATAAGPVDAGPVDAGPVDAGPVEAGLVDAGLVVPSLQVELKYSTADNFLGRDVYGSLEICRLQRYAADMLAAADAALRAAHPSLQLHAYDCARPHAVQVAMWDIVRDTPQRGYVADPAGVGSIHNYGCAVDLTLATSEGAALDMGTPFDFFGQAAQPRHERAMRLAGTLSADQLANRLLLREVMVRAGFFPLDNEWWHFDCLPAGEVRTRWERLP